MPHLILYHSLLGGSRRCYYYHYCYYYCYYNSMERKTVGSLPGYAYAAGAGSPLFSVAGARPAFAVASLTRPKAPTPGVRQMADLEVLRLKRVRGATPAIVCLPGVAVAGAAISLRGRRAGGQSNWSCWLPSLGMKPSRRRVRQLASALARHVAQRTSPDMRAFSPEKSGPPEGRRGRSPPAAACGRRRCPRRPGGLGRRRTQSPPAKMVAARGKPA